MCFMAAWRVGAPIIGDIFSGGFETTDIPNMPGFRKIGDGSISAAGFDPFLGVDPNRIPPSPLIGTISDNLHYEQGGGVPVAEFTDYNCPYCKILAEDVHALEETGAITLSLHHLPLLGDDSVAASRVALSVGDPMFHRDLMSSRFRVTGDYARRLAQDQNRDIGPITQGDAHIGRSKALAARFGIIGTPALVVGRTLVIGQISAPRLSRLVEIERKEALAT